jgi:jumonji domain-containing protein 7
VRQGEQVGEATIALNWWYDVEMRGMSWVWLGFLRGRIGEAPNSDAEEDE